MKPPSLIEDAPLRFAPVYASALWGGTQIARRYHRRQAPPICSESWELSAHPDGLSRVLDGPCAGMTLAELAQRYGRDLLGRAAPDADRFPLLFKLIDARERLSIQVHPGDAHPLLAGEERKTEMWLLLDAAPGAELYAGFVPGTTADHLRAALGAGRAGALLARLDAIPGQALFIPGGLVHAIGEGCLIYEVQQSSNTTYRLYDWDRRDANGRLRPLHLEAALRCIDWRLPPPALRSATPLDGPPPNRRALVHGCPWFQMRRLSLTVPERLHPDGHSFQALFVETGCVEVATARAALTLSAGASCLIPAAVPAYDIRPVGGDALLLLTDLP